MTVPMFDFSGSVADLALDGLYVKPILQNYLHEATYPGFSLWFPPRKESRQPDGYFHPSSHPGMTERQLYYYLTQPERMIPESLEFMSTMSITIGTALHGWVQFCLGPKNAGILVPPAAGHCLVCRMPTAQMPAKGKCWEHGVVDEASKSRGHMDGMIQHSELGLGGWEFKTSNFMKLAKIEDNDVALYIKKWPEYYLQNQDYLRITGLPWIIVTFMSLGYPWDMKEFMIERDLAVIAALDHKYRAVLSYVEAGQEPPACCAPRSKTAKECFARGVCPIGRL